MRCHQLAGAGAGIGAGCEQAEVCIGTNDLCPHLGKSYLINAITKAK
ncbi:hypothetical protein ACFLTJ_02105 [Chloroflexota bacterium]